MGISSQEERAVFFPPLPMVPVKSTRQEYHDSVVHALTRHRSTLERAISQLTVHAAGLTEAAECLVETLSTGHKVLVAGNGGSAAEAQHFASELVGRFKRERAPYAALALTTDSSILTAIANDYGYQEVFARQILAFGQPGDLLLVFSTSGESENVVRAAMTGKQCQMSVVAVTADRTSRLESLADLTIRVPALDTETAQELHMVVTHILCDIAEQRLSACEEAL